VCSGRSGIGPITLFDASDLETKFAGEVKGFDAAGHFGRKEARRMDRFTQFGLAAALQAVASANLVVTDLNRDRIGAYIGTGIGGVATLIEGLETLRTSGARRVSPFMVPLMLPDSGGAQVAIHLGIRGPNLAVVSACATGTNAIGEAVEVVRCGC
jgi:3-oxoacyl-[acyl-carrier-protein] synthase II